MSNLFTLAIFSTYENHENIPLVLSHLDKQKASYNKGLFSSLEILAKYFND